MKSYPKCANNQDDNLEYFKGFYMNSFVETDKNFILNPQLEQETLVVGDFLFSHVLLMDDRRFPWLILVPKRNGITELTDLTEDEAHVLMDEVRLTQSVLHTLRDPDKLNVATLGNSVPQLHIHVIARFISDAAWPNPVWGVGNPESYPAHTAQIFIDSLRDAFKSREVSWISGRP